MKFEILYHFSHGPVHLLETKRLDLPSSAGPGDIYQWHFIEEDTVHLLTFDSMILNPQTRIFKEGSVMLDLNSCRGEIFGKKLELIRHDGISDRLRNLVHKSLEKK